jgi:hypothetical protein
MKNNIPKPQVSEDEALVTLIQVYLSHTSKWYSSLIAAVVGVVAIPVVALNITITSNHMNNFLFSERSFFSILTLFLLLASLYFVSKVNYSLALLDQLYQNIEVKNINLNLLKYLIQQKSVLISKFRTFQKMYRFQRDVTGSLNLGTILVVIGSFAVGVFLLLMIWWGYGAMWQALALFASIYAISLIVLFRQVPIL